MNFLIVSAVLYLYITNAAVIQDRAILYDDNTRLQKRQPPINAWAPNLIPQNGALYGNQQRQHVSSREMSHRGQQLMSPQWNQPSDVQSIPFEDIQGVQKIVYDDQEYDDDDVFPGVQWQPYHGTPIQDSEQGSGGFGRQNLRLNLAQLGAENRVTDDTDLSVPSLSYSESPRLPQVRHDDSFLARDHPMRQGFVHNYDSDEEQQDTSLLGFEDNGFYIPDAIQSDSPRMEQNMQADNFLDRNHPLRQGFQQQSHQDSDLQQVSYGFDYNDGDYFESSDDEQGDGDEQQLQQAIDNSLIENNPQREYQVDDNQLRSRLQTDCTICRDKTIDVVQLDCDHCFCFNCIKPWLQLNNECPNCRAPQPRIAQLRRRFQASQV